jgi:hypothetical protein
MLASDIWPSKKPCSNELDWETDLWNTYFPLSMMSFLESKFYFCEWYTYHCIKFRKSLVKRLSSVERHEQELISCYIMNKTIINKTRQHDLGKPSIPSLPRGRPTTRLIKSYQDIHTLFEKLLRFTIPLKLFSLSHLTIFLPHPDCISLL